MNISPNCVKSEIIARVTTSFPSFAHEISISEISLYLFTVRTSGNNILIIRYYYLRKRNEMVSLLKQRPVLSRF